MRTQVLRWAVTGLIAPGLGLGVVVAWVVAADDVSSTSLVNGYLKETARLVQCGVARVTPFGPADEDYRVYGAVMKTMWPKSTGGPPAYLLTDWPKDVRPIPTPNAACFDAAAPVAPLRRDFENRNRARWGLSARLGGAAGSGSLGPIELARGELGGGSPERVEFSRIGYDETQHRALLYLAHYCALCGGGYYLLLERDSHNDWAVIGQCPMWVS